MSFSQETKAELAHYTPEKDCCMLAEIAGFIRMCGSISLAGFGKFTIHMPTDSPAIARHYKTLVKDYFDVDAQIEVGEATGLKSGKEYTLILGPEQNSEAILREIGILMIKGGMNYFTDGIYDGLIKTKCCRRSYLRGAFMAAGTVNNPEKGYHFEISCSSQVLSQDIRKLIKTFTDLTPKIVERKAGRAVYLKSGTQILDVLAIMEAHGQRLQYDKVMMMKELRNQTVRAINCDSANVDKIVKTASKEIEAIRKIERLKGLDFLPEKLRAAAQLRLDNPGASFTEIGELMEPPVGRSGVSKRFKKIEELAENLEG